MQAWVDFLKHLEKDFGSETVTKWLRSLKVLKFDAQNLFLEADDTFQAVWFEEHVRVKASKILLTNNQKPLKIHLKIKDPSPSSKGPMVGASSPLFYSQDALRKGALFENFVVTEDNAMVFQTLSDLVGFDKATQTFGPPKLEHGLYNPILIYGPHESGKTQLLMATQHAFVKSGLKSIYVKADTFTDHVVKAIRSGNMMDFRKTYRHQDALIVDGVEVLSGKAATQEEFFHTFNTLHTAGKQIILSSSLAPRFLQDIEPRLISRFEWGLALPIKALNESGRLLLVEEQLKKFAFSTTPDTKLWLARTFTQPSHIIKALDILHFRSQLFRQKQGQILPLDVAESYLKGYEKELKDTISSPHRIIQELADIFKVKMEDVIGKSQAREHTIPRQIAMYACRLSLKMPYAKIGGYFSRDHSTVMSSVKQVETALQSNETLVVTAITDLYRKIGIA